MKKGRLDHQHIYIRFCLQLDKMVPISQENFEALNELPYSSRFSQCIN